MSSTPTTSDDARTPEEALLPRLRELVLSGTYTPGAALSEVRLAEHFAVSRTPVREALKQLQTEGLVEIRPKVGTFVRQITRREVVELFAVKEALESLAVRLMAQRGRTETWDLLEDNIARSHRAAEAGDAAAYATLVHEFHQALVDGADNRKLAEHYRTLMNQLAYHRLVLRTLDHPGRLTASVAEHRRVFDLIMEKDAVGAEWAMRDHVASSAREVLTDSTALDAETGP